ncbi:alpha/beta fold hydrolase [Amycolatopsis sp. EV170708-02-1]|uniref:alpha/beta fold hydrolase n=1 Tax=Amycolatopsis sp. EV170708-02-1 TaxID=2919322 RepID=UPI001F0C3324|nr:alpha/beta fold hydrolase [Amycolatopsis sp. EV170708-02-1]UMP03522.1 alpha/beta hydrolase [Amycolatopsis sp. EV170708-02-1]
MSRKASALIALCCAVAGVALSACDEATEAESESPASSSAPENRAAFTGTQKLKVGERSVNVSCAGNPVAGRPVVVLLHGGGDDLGKLSGLQNTLAAQGQVCSYDRLGAGASDQPDGPQSFESTGKILTGVLDQVAGGKPVVLAGHSLGGLIAARYSPDHQDRVKGLVLMDATSPTQEADLRQRIPDSATGMAAELRAQTLAVFAGQGPEKLVVTDAEVRSAGNIPVEVIQHGKQYLTAVPEYGPGLEQAWSEGQRKWLALSGRSNLSTAANSEHYIYVDQPDLAVRAIQRVVGEAKSE